MVTGPFRHHAGQTKHKIVLISRLSIRERVRKLKKKKKERRVASEKI